MKIIRKCIRELALGLSELSLELSEDVTSEVIFPSVYLYQSSTPEEI